jgi:hypothetical protein
MKPGGNQDLRVVHDQPQSTAKADKTDVIASPQGAATS